MSKWVKIAIGAAVLILILGAVGYYLQSKTHQAQRRGCWAKGGQWTKDKQQWLESDWDRTEEVIDLDGSVWGKGIRLNLRLNEIDYICDNRPATARELECQKLRQIVLDKAPTHDYTVLNGLRNGWDWNGQSCVFNSFGSVLYE